MIRVALLSALAWLLLCLPDGEALAAPARESYELKGVLDEPDAVGMSADLDRDRLREFYASRAYQPLWIDRSGPSIPAWQLREVLENADREGLEPKAYHLKSIDRLWRSIHATKRARLDLLLTDAFFLYSRHVSRGRHDPFEVDPLWNIDVPDVDPVALLESTLEAENFSLALQSLAPPHPGYRWLRDALAKYKRLAAQGGWPTIRTNENLKYGQTHAVVAVLRQRLIAEGDLQLPPVYGATYFDQPLKYATVLPLSNIMTTRRHFLRSASGVLGLLAAPAALARMTNRDERVLHCHNLHTGVAKRSLHTQGKAIDIRLPGVNLKELREAALRLKAGGVGYYPDSNFIHVDTGRPRFW